MSVATPYTTEARIARLMGQLGLDLRTDDVPDSDAHIDSAIDAGTCEADFFYADYAVAGVAADEMAQQAATYFACRWLCEHRLNEPSAGLDKACERLEKKLELIRTRKARPRIARARRPAVVTTHTVVLRDFNNQGKVDTTRSTGVAKDYKRPTDYSAPDNR
jgi:hypothetical protein